MSREKGGSSGESRDPDITVFVLVCGVLDWSYSEVGKVVWASLY